MSIASNCWSLDSIRNILFKSFYWTSDVNYFITVHRPETSSFPSRDANSSFILTKWKRFNKNKFNISIAYNTTSYQNIVHCYQFGVRLRRNRLDVKEKIIQKYISPSGQLKIFYFLIHQTTIPLPFIIIQKKKKRFVRSDLFHPNETILLYVDRRYLCIWLRPRI